MQPHRAGGVAEGRSHLFMASPAPDRTLLRIFVCILVVLGVGFAASLLFL